MTRGRGRKSAPETSVPRRRSLRRNISAALSGNVVYTVCQFGILVAIAQLTTVAEVGRYALALAITGPVFVFAGLKLRQVQVTDANGLNRPGDFFGLRIVTSLVAFTVSTLIAVGVGLPAASTWVLVAVAANKALEGQIDIFYGAMQRREQLQLVARSQIVRGVVGLLVFTMALVVTRDVLAGASALAVATALQAGVNAWRVRALGVPTRPAFAGDVLRSLARLALPLGVSVAVGSLLTNVPRYVLQAHEGAAALGVFAVLAYGLNATGIVAASIAEAASPRLANLYAAGKQAAFLRTLWRLVALGLGLGLAGVMAAALAGGWFLGAVFGPEYAAQRTVLVVLMTAGAVQLTAVFVGTSVNAMRLFTVQVPITAAALVTVGLTALVAVPEHGLLGGALSVLAGQVVQGVLYLVLVRRVVVPRLRSAAGAVGGASPPRS